jgi:hypothetical protein
VGDAAAAQHPSERASEAMGAGRCALHAAVSVIVTTAVVISACYWTVELI